MVPIMQAVQVNNPVKPGQSQPTLPESEPTADDDNSTGLEAPPALYPASRDTSQPGYPATGVSGSFREREKDEPRTWGRQSSAASVAGLVGRDWSGISGRTTNDMPVQRQVLMRGLRVKVSASRGGGRGRVPGVEVGACSRGACAHAGLAEKPGGEEGVPGWGGAWEELWVKVQCGRWHRKG